MYLLRWILLYVVAALRSDALSSMEGEAALIGAINPASHFVTISRGVFSKALGFGDLTPSLLPLLAAGLALLLLSVLFLRKQAR